MEYPKYKYHATNNPVIVNSAEDEDALGSGWEDSPAAHNLPPTAPSQEQLSDLASNQEILAEEEAYKDREDKVLRRVDLATAQRTVRKAPVKFNPLKKSSGLDGDAGDWTAEGQDKAGFPVPKGSNEDVTN